MGKRVLISSSLMLALCLSQTCPSEHSQVRVLETEVFIFLSEQKQQHELPTSSHQGLGVWSLTRISELPSDGNWSATNKLT